MSGERVTDLYTQDLALAEGIARTAGEMIREGAANPQVRTKADHTPVTDVDIAVNRHVLDALGQHRPADSVLGEELSDTRGSGRTWVCDPLDGTWLYAHGVPLSMFSLALVQDGIPVVGVIYDPWQDRMFSAAASGGATLNGRPAMVRTGARVGGSCVTLPGCVVKTLDAAGMFTDAVRAGADVVTVGSVVHDATFVAAGFAVGHVYPYSSPWDMAAVAVIVQEAGGTVTDLLGRAQRYDGPIHGAIVSNGAAHPDLLAMVSRNLK